MYVVVSMLYTVVKIANSMIKVITNTDVPMMLSRMKNRNNLQWLKIQRKDWLALET